MIWELLVGTVMVMLTVVIHSGGLALLGRVLHAETDGDGARKVRWGSARALGFTMITVLALFVLHGLEIWLYAALYYHLGATPDLREAVYFSTSTYAAIGFADLPLAESWKLLGGIEGINGILLIGWTTAFLVTVMSRFEWQPRRARARKVAGKDQETGVSSKKATPAGSGRMNSR